MLIIWAFFNYLDIYYEGNLQAKHSIMHSFWCAVSRYNILEHLFYAVFL